MPKAKKISKNSWRVRVYAYTDDNGKKIYESFISDTKAGAELMASEFASNKKRRTHSNLTVSEAITGYILAKDGVLSPSTIRGYHRMLANNYSTIGKKKIRTLTSEDLQIFVSDLARSGQSPKSIKNIYSLLTSSVALYAPNMSFKVTLPTRYKKEQISPSDDDVMRLFNAADHKLRVCIALAAFGSLRRGELCALKYSDIRENGVYVHADIIQDKDGKWLYKNSPKEKDSIRFAPLPSEIIELLGEGDPDEFVVKYAIPNSVSNRFNTLRHKLGITGIRFHDLRHYYASIGTVLGVPDTYLANFGGWAQGSNVLKTTYQNRIVPIQEGYAKRMTDHFSDMINKKV